jgi:hypothetical protein
MENTHHAIELLIDAGERFLAVSAAGSFTAVK